MGAIMQMVKSGLAAHGLGSSGSEEEMQKRVAAARAGMPSLMKKGGSVKSSASRRADGIAMRGKTKGRII